MRALKAATIGMGVLIVVATITLVVLIIQRAHPAPALPQGAIVLAEPAGTRIVGIAPAGANLAIALTGGGPDRIVLLDPSTLRSVARLTLDPRSNLP